MNQFHVCLADPASGRSTPGDQADCPQCRRVLLLSFLVPADAPEAKPNGCPFCSGSLNPDLTDHVRNVHPEQFLSWKRHPHLMVPDRFTRSLELRPPEALDPFVPDTRTHVTEHGTESDPDQPGGEWFARCTCGWSETGHYSRDGAKSEQVAGRLAKVKAYRHRHQEEDK